MVMPFRQASYAYDTKTQKQYLPVKVIDTHYVNPLCAGNCLACKTTYLCNCITAVMYYLYVHLYMHTCCLHTTCLTRRTVLTYLYPIFRCFFCCYKTQPHVIKGKVFQRWTACLIYVKYVYQVNTTCMLYFSGKLLPIGLNYVARHTHGVLHLTHTYIYIYYLQVHDVLT